MADSLTSDSVLWCLHVIGPDDVHPAPSEAEARRAAKVMNEHYKDTPEISFEAAPWPYSAETHADDVSMFYIVAGISPHDE